MSETRSGITTADDAQSIHNALRRPRRSAGLNKSKKFFRKPTLLLADDHPIVVEGISRLLQSEFELIGAVGDGWALLEAAKRLNPEVIVADVSMPLLNGIDAVRRLRKDNLHSKVLILSMHLDAELATEALLAGASGYVLKHSATEVLSDAIRHVMAGHIYISPRIAIDVMNHFTQSTKISHEIANPLTVREREVLQLVEEGSTLRGIASVLQITIRTVVFHKSNIMDKLGLRTTADLTQYAIKKGIISLELFNSDDVVGESRAS